MMEYPASIQSFEFAGTSIQLLLPEAAAVQEKYLQAKKNNADIIFPYWAKLWPSSIALCKFISANQSLFTNKNVLELAAGLGLPSMLVAKFAKHVVCSDYAEEALHYIQESAKINYLDNVEVMCIDWNNFPDHINADIVLLSDINYEPAEFKKLLGLIISLRKKNCKIILTTPQRLMAKPFVEKLLPYSALTENIQVEFQQDKSDIFLLQL